MRYLSLPSTKENKMNWFKDLYDDFRRRRALDSISEEETKRDVDFIYNVLKLFEGAKVLDLFCGAGRHSIELASRNCNPVGIEYNPDYLKLARERSKEKEISPEFIQSDVRYVDFGEGYDGAIIMRCSFGYFSDEEDRMVLEKIYGALKKQGRFLIEIISRDWLLNHFEERAEMVIDSVKVVEEREFDILTSRNNFTIKRYEKDGIVAKKGSWRFYSVHEIKNILENIGFKFVAGYSNLNKEPLTKDTRLMRLVFEK